MQPMIWEETYADIKDIINASAFPYEYDDRVEQGERMIVVMRNSFISHIAYISPLLYPGDPGYGGSACEEWDTVYAGAAGERTFFQKSWEFDLYNGGNEKTIDFKLVNPAGADVTAYLSKGRYYFKNCLFADTLKMQVVDVDNILGYGAGTVLITLLDKKLPDGVAAEDIKPPDIDYRVLRYKILAGLYIRLVVHMDDPGARGIVSMDYEYTGG